MRSGRPDSRTQRRNHQMNVDINNVAEHINTSITAQDMHISNDIDDDGTHSEHNPVTININADGIAINGCKHTEPIMTMTATPATPDNLAYVTIQFAIGKLDVDTGQLTATKDESGVIHFGTIRD